MRRKPQFAWAALAAVATLVAVLLVGVGAPAQAGPPEDAVLDWNQYAVEALVNVPTGPVPNAGQGPTVAIIHLAMVQGAVYDAVNMIDGGHEPYLDDLPSAPASASMPAAVATAAHHVLVGMVVVPASGGWDRRPAQRALCRLARARSRTVPRRPPGSQPGRLPPRRCSPSGRATAGTGRSGSRAARTPENGGRPPPRSARHRPARATPTPGWRGSSRSCSRARRSSARRGRTRSRAAPTQRSTTR